MLNRIFGTHRLTPAGPNELWVADLTFIAIARGFVYLAVILDAWSRRVVGYAVGRAIDTRLTLAALRSEIANRRPSPGCVHHSDRGAQYAADQYREMLAEHGLRGSMGRRGGTFPIPVALVPGHLSDEEIDASS
jgi:putative transposase